MNALEITNCPTMEVLAAIVEGHDGKTEQVLRLNGTTFEVRLSAVGELKRSILVPAVIASANRIRQTGNLASFVQTDFAKSEKTKFIKYALFDGDLPGDKGRWETYAELLARGMDVGNPDSWEIVEEWERPSPSKGSATLESERSRVAKELRKNKLPKKAVTYGPVPVREWAECLTLCDGQGYYRPEHGSFVGPLRRVFDRRGKTQQDHANALRLSTSDYWQK